MICFLYVDVDVNTRFDIIRRILPLKKLGFQPGYLNLLTKKMGVVEMSTTKHKLPTNWITSTFKCDMFTPCRCGCHHSVSDGRCQILRVP